MFDKKSKVFLRKKVVYQVSLYSHAVTWVPVSQYDNIAKFVKEAWRSSMFFAGESDYYGPFLRWKNTGDYVLLDETNHPVDPALIYWYASQYGVASLPRYYYGYRKFKFRDGPVEGIRNWSRGPRYSNVRTMNEIRAYVAVETDEDCLEYNIKGRSSRGRGYLPNSYDGRNRRREKCWKSQRETQWKA